MYFWETVQAPIVPMKKSLPILLFFLFSFSLYADDLFPGRLTLDEALAPFYHGVASGDVTADKALIWTRVTTDQPQAEVIWRVATDSFFNNVVAQGTTVTDGTRDFTVKVDVAGLNQNTWYFYEFEYDTKLSIRGRTKTLPTENLSQFRVAFVSCASYPHGFYNAYARLNERNDISAIIHLGDYIYEYGENEYGNNPERIPEPSNAIVSLSDYRTRYSQYRLDTMLMRLHQNYPFFTVWDDHEFANNSYKDGAENHNPNTEGSWLDRKNAALQAYKEWLPIRDVDPDNDFKIYRKAKIGNLAEIFFLDTRIIGRDNENDPDTPEKRLIGEEQMQWLLDGLGSSTATWKILAQQVMLAPLLIGDLTLNPDQWDGYTFERKRLFDYVNSNDIKNLVVLTGDIHSNWANELPFGSVPYNSTTGAGSAGVEFVGTSITSPGFTINAPLFLLQLFNPHMKHSDLTRRGYSILNLTPQRAQCDYHVVGPIFEPNTSENLQVAFYTDVNTNRLVKAFNETSAAVPNIDLSPKDPRVKTATSVTEMPALGTVIGAYPNPFIDRVGLQYYLHDAKNLRMQVVDMSGRLIIDKQLGLRTPGLQYDIIDGAALPGGQYYLFITEGTYNAGRNVIKAK
jgi:alkaline phosphatase D